MDRETEDSEARAEMREGRRTTDLSRATLPISMAWTIMIAIIVLCGFVWRMDSRIDLLTDRLERREKFDEQIKTERDKNTEMLKKYLEDQITIAGLRNAAMGFSTALDAERRR